jgi:hypothetical protein
MKIEPQTLTTCEVAPDGNAVILGFEDTNGALAMPLPDLITKALRSRYGDHSLRYAYPLASWSVEQSSDPQTGMVTLCTTDGFSVCFSMQQELQQELGEALASGRASAVQILAN